MRAAAVRRPPRRTGAVLARDTFSAAARSASAAAASSRRAPPRRGTLARPRSGASSSRRARPRSARGARRSAGSRGRGPPQPTRARSLRRNGAGRRSARPLSIHSARRCHSLSNASCATSTVAAPDAGSRSTASSRFETNASTALCIVTRSMSSDASSSACTTRRVAVPAPTRTSRRNNCRAASCRSGSSRVNVSSARLATARRSPPSASYRARVSSSPSRRSNSSVSAYWNSGSAFGWRLTSPTNSASRPGSNDTPTRSAGFAAAASSSRGPSGSSVHDVFGQEPAEDRVGQRTVEEVGAEHGEHPQAVSGFLGGGHEARRGTGCGSRRRRA